MRLLDLITKDPGINRKKLYEGVGGHAQKEELNASLEYLVSARLAYSKICKTGGRPGECWFPGVDDAKPNDQPDAHTDEATVGSIARTEAAEESPTVASPCEPSQSIESGGGVFDKPEPNPVRIFQSGVKVEEIPSCPNRPFASMSLTELFDAVRKDGGRFVMIDGAVHAVCENFPTPAIKGAVVEYQEQLRVLVGENPPTDQELFMYRLDAMGSDKDQKREWR